MGYLYLFSARWLDEQRPEKLKPKTRKAESRAG